MTCGSQGTAFLIDESRVITARHCVKENINNDEPIKLEFYAGSDKSIIKEAKVVAESLEHDIALLEIQEKADHIQEWLSLNSNSYDSKEDEWETMGYPREWNVENEGSTYCYITGNLYLDSSLFDDSKTYDKQLTSNFIKDDWPYGLAGLSGAPLVVNNKIVGIIIKEEFSAIKSQLKSVSFCKSAEFLLGNGVEIDSSIADSNDFLKRRLQLQKNVCTGLFNKVDHSLVNSEININVDFYYLKYGASGTKRVDELASHLAEVLNQYACDLTDLANAAKDLNKHLDIYRKVNRLVDEVQKGGKLGTMLLWMLIEGILEMPKMYTRIRNSRSTSELNYVSNDVHAGMKNSQLVLFIGGGILNECFETGISTLIKELEVTANIDSDILFYDQYSYDNLGKGPLKGLIDNFYQYRDWSKVGVELTVFTGYDSDLLEMLEKDGMTGPRIEAELNRYFIDELSRNYDYICNQILSTSDVKKVKINWFLLPFNKISDFEDLLISKLI
ncbi:Hachiman antiphage defense system protein HamA [Paenibacillus sp. MAH-36]|uniref:Hachiman antiphage defense system protein HamA n=1 Tax=Paenibacillus violae TaxID=3077234 RepID=A0ABU3RNM4_9BACL|nr:Hachiman antiphage defense system protein HamA [Paenibacillus sp. PFR10]MDU0205823.1 Hachiman antiphage defense system protein HamA [Paenibacillus sp. PFR10]